MELKPDDRVHYLQVLRGSVTVHNERVVHGSDGSRSASWRRTYVTAFRSQKTVEYERKMGFTHSHNDKVNWDEFHKEWLKEKEDQKEK